MNDFDTLYKTIMEMDNTSAGSFGDNQAIGNCGGSFPASGDAAYAPGDNRPFDPAKMVLGSKKKKKGKKVIIPIQRRKLSI